MNRLLLMIIIPLFLSAQNITSISLKDENGKRYDVSANLAKDANLVIFWATWCFPCKKEFKELDVLLKKYPDKDINVIALATDEPRTIAKVKMFVKQHNYPFTYLLDPEGKAKEIFMINEIPVTFLADAKGRVVFSQTGYRSGDVMEIEKQMQKLCNQAGSK